MWIHPAERRAKLEEEIERKNNALIVGLAALGHLRKTGSLSKVMREEAITKMQHALNEKLF